MSFTTATLSKIAQSMGRDTRVPGIFTYKTEDATATVAGANYFILARMNLIIGDRILVTVVTNINSASEAYVANAEYIVTGVSSSAVTIVAV